MASSMESLWFRSKSTACSSMKGLRARRNVITRGQVFTRVSLRTIWRTGVCLTIPRAHNPTTTTKKYKKNQDVLERLINAAVTMWHAVSVTPCASAGWGAGGGNVHNFPPAAASGPRMRRVEKRRRAAGPALVFPLTLLNERGEFKRRVSLHPEHAKLRKHTGGGRKKKVGRRRTPRRNATHPESAQLTSCYPIRSSGHAHCCIRVRLICLSRLAGKRSLKLVLPKLLVVVLNTVMCL